jgi:hypothetical protein
MEYLQRWADRARLESLRAVLRKMNELSGIRISETWINKRTADLPSSGLLSKPQRDPCAPIQRDKVTRITKRSRLRLGSPEYKAMRSAISKGIWDRPGYREKLTAIIRQQHAERWQNPEYREKRSADMSKQSTERWQQPEYRERETARLGQQNIDMWQNPEYREKHSARVSRQSAERWQQPDYKERVSASLGEGARRRWAGDDNQAQREAHSDAVSIKRNDDDPKAKAWWDSLVSAAEEYALNLPEGIADTNKRGKLGNH